jgi:hypothetical protein
MGTLPKNGHDQAQDRDIRELREHFRQVQVQNDKDHSVIKDVLGDLQLSMTAANERLNATRTVAVVVWTLFILALGGIGWVVNQAAEVIKGVDQKLDAVDTRQQSDAAKGWQWGRDLEKGVDHNEDDIQELQKLHRRKPRED